MLVDLFYHYKDISPDFIADYLVGNNPHPTIRNDKLRLIPRLKPTFVVMSCHKKERCFKSSDTKVGIADCYDFVLMDGSKTLFAARLNSGLTKQIHGYNILPGASITVLDWDIIPLCHSEVEPIMNRMVMFIKAFTWTTAPSINSFAHPEMASSDEWTTDTFQKALFDFDMVRDVEQNKSIRMYNWCMDRKTGTWRYTGLAETGVVYGYWIRHEETKIMWKNQLASRKKEALVANLDTEDDNKCTCKEVYDLRQCVLITYPVGQVCKLDIYDQVAERIGTDNICSLEFDGFQPSHKRWSMYWYFAINILNARGKARWPLPPCFVKAVRDLYPEPGDILYTGCVPANPKHELEQLPRHESNKKFKSGVYDDSSSGSSGSESD
jgi:hypothetical protein